MGKHTPRHGWLEREWAKFPVGTRVKNILPLKNFYGSGRCGTIVGYFHAHSGNTACAWVLYDGDTERHGADINNLVIIGESL